ncbi:hypothetical protein K440DRAFT_544157, partial [Wilcoxina mikolae CBS 423.85]
LVCAQTVWMMAQCIARKSNALPITLLEGHTMAHVLCAVFMYGFWWHKPLDVQYPIVLNLEPELAAEIYYSAPRGDLLMAGVYDYPYAGNLTRIPQKLKSNERYGDGAPHLTIGSSDLLRNTFNFSGFLLSATVLPILYGMIHAVAWNSQFPTPVERLLWRISAVLVGATPLVCVFCLVPGISLAGGDGDMDPDPPADLPRFFMTILTIMGLIVALAGAFLYPFARLYLIIESFLSLRSLPKGSFQTVAWTNYWPHF